MAIQSEVDIVVTGGGSVYLFEPTTPAGESWIEENVDPDAQWFAGRLAVEARYAGELAQGMMRAGLVVV